MIGIDLVYISGFEEQLKVPGSQLAQVVFTPAELLVARRRGAVGGVLACCLAGRWAVKEALIKAWSQTLLGNQPPIARDQLDWREIEVQPDAYGRVSISLHGTVSRHFHDQEWRLGPSLSTSHDGDYAIAVIRLDQSGAVLIDGFLTATDQDAGTEDQHAQDCADSGDCGCLEWRAGRDLLSLHISFVESTIGSVGSCGSFAKCLGCTVGLGLFGPRGAGLHSFFAFPGGATDAEVRGRIPAAVGGTVSNKGVECAVIFDVVGGRGDGFDVERCREAAVGGHLGGADKLSGGESTSVGDGELVLLGHRDVDAVVAGFESDAGDDNCGAARWVQFRGGQAHRRGAGRGAAAVGAAGVAGSTGATRSTRSCAATGAGACAACGL